LILGTTGVAIRALSLWARGPRRNPLAARADHPSAGPQPRTHVLRPLARSRFGPVDRSSSRSSSAWSHGTTVEAHLLARRSSVRDIRHVYSRHASRRLVCDHPAPLPPVMGVRPFRGPPSRLHPAPRFTPPNIVSSRSWPQVLARLILFPCFRTPFPHVFFATPCATEWTLSYFHT
jgi:hypothetical protein